MLLLLLKLFFKESNMLCAVNNSVRLACLKHAASVRPEPGSNSNVIYLYLYIFRLVCTYTLCVCLFGSITLSKLTLFQFLYFLFNFHGSSLPHSVGQRLYITIYILPLSTTFSIFFCLFCTFFYLSCDTLAPVVKKFSSFYKFWVDKWEKRG